MKKEEIKQSEGKGKCVCCGKLTGKKEMLNFCSIDCWRRYHYAESYPNLKKCEL